MDTSEPDFSDRKKKFRRTLTIASSKDNQILGALRLAKLSDFKAVAEDYLRIARKRFNVSLLSIINLQWHILADMIFAEKTIQGLKEQKQAAKPEEDTELIDREIFIYELFRNKLKDIGDVLAWKLFDYNRSIIYMLSDHEESGYIQKEGLSGELLTFLMKYHNDGELPIINCITNCLRYGDIVSKTEQGIFNIIEVKSGVRCAKKRGQKQLKAIDDVIFFLNESYKEESGRKWLILPLDYYPRNYFKQLTDCIATANNKGYAFKKLNEYSYTTVMNFDKIDNEDIFDKLEDLHRKMSEGWNGFILGFSNYDRFDFSPIIMPYSIFPFSEKTCIDLMFGSLSVTTYINFDLLAANFAKSGLNVLKTPKDIIESQPNKLIQEMFVLKLADFVFPIPPSMIYSLFFEFRHPDLFKKEIIAAKNALEPSEEPYILTYNKQERKIWK